MYIYIYINVMLYYFDLLKFIFENISFESSSGS